MVGAYRGFAPRGSAGIDPHDTRFSTGTRAGGTPAPVEHAGFGTTPARHHGLLLEPGIRRRVTKAIDRSWSDPVRRVWTWPLALAVNFASPLAGGHLAFAEVPAELQGQWSSHPARCEQANGEVDVLTITATGLDFYEIGCELAEYVRSGTDVSFDAQCYKGGSPAKPGKVVIRRHGSNKIDIALEGFSWTSSKPESFRRC